MHYVFYIFLFWMETILVLQRKMVLKNISFFVENQ